MQPSSDPPSDEAFWREQEKRHHHLEQPCCTQSNMCWALVDMPGDITVVVHGEADCLNSFFHHQGRQTTSVFCTRLTDRQIVTGDTGRPLRHLLTLIASERQPAAVLVLGTCPVEVIGDRFETVVDDVARNTGVPMVALHTHGLALMGQTRCQDWLYAELAGLPQLEGSASSGLNLVGLPQLSDPSEAERLFEQVGLRINGLYPNGTSLQAWRSVSHAAKSFVVDRQMFPRLTERLRSFEQQVEDVVAPIGVEQTAILYQGVADAFGVGGEMTQALEPLLEEHRGRLAQTAARVGRRRLAMCIRMFKTHRSDRLAFDGLADLPMLRSLGFDITVYVQGPPEPGARQRFAERLEALGYGDVPFDVFQGPWLLGDRLKDGGFELAVLSDVARNVVEEAGLQMIPGGAFEPFFSGMGANLRLIDRVLETL